MSTTFTANTTIKSAEVNANFLEKKARTYSTTATAAGTTTLTVSSNQLQFFTGTTTQTVTLPVASTMSLGYGFEIFNLSTGVVTVNSSGANSVQAMASGSKLEVICILASGTTAASWQVIYTPAFATGLLPIVNGGTNNASLSVVGGVIYYGEGTKITALANGTAGQTLKSQGTTLSPVWGADLNTIQTKTANYTALTSDSVINCSGSAFTITLYAATGNSGKQITINKTDAPFANIITIDGNGSETINGALTTTLNVQYESVTLYCDGANWFIQIRNTPNTWTAYTPTINGFGTPTSVNFVWRKVGDSIQILGSFTTGTPTGATSEFTLPTGLTADSGVISTYTYYGDWIRIIPTGSTRKRGKLVIAGGSSLVGMTSDDYTTALGPASGLAGSSAFGTAESAKISAFNIPITGWK